MPESTEAETVDPDAPVSRRVAKVDGTFGKTIELETRQARPGVVTVDIDSGVPSARALAKAEGTFATTIPLETRSPEARAEAHAAAEAATGEGD